MNPDHTPNTRSVWPTLQVKTTRWKKWARIGMLQPAMRQQFTGCLF